MSTADATVEGGEVPIGGGEVCSLPENRLRDRISMIRREIAPHAVARRERADGIAWDFPASPEMEAKLENLIGLERQCCGGLEWGLVADPASQRLTLEVGGVDPKTFAPLMEVTPGRPPRGSGPLGLLAKAGGIGVGVSLVVCCVLPIGAAALLGAAVAAPFAKLDHPLVIVGASLAFAIPAWGWLQRHRTASAALVCEDDC